MTPFRGSYAVLATPFTADGRSVDVDMLRCMVKWQIESRVERLIPYRITLEPRLAPPSLASAAHIPSYSSAPVDNSLHCGRRDTGGTFDGARSPDNALLQWSRLFARVNRLCQAQQ